MTEIPPPPDDVVRQPRPAVLGRLRRLSPSAVFGLAAVALIVGAAAAAPLLAPYGPDQFLGSPFQPPDGSYPLGLDDNAHDVFSRLVWGARTSLVVGVLATAFAVAVATLVGVVAGYAGGWVDGVLMAITDFVLVIPGVPLMVLVAALWGPSLRNIILIIGFFSWPGTARVLRAQVVSLRQRAYVRRARSLGAGHAYVVVRHVLPQLGPLVMASASLTIAGAIFAESALAFLGLSDPQVVSWGKMIDSAFRSSAISARAWWAIMPPGIAISVVVLGFSLTARAVEDALNPRLATSHLAAGPIRLQRVPMGAS